MLGSVGCIGRVGAAGRRRSQLPPATFDDTPGTVESLWSGAITSSSVRVAVSMPSQETVRLAVSRNADLTDAVYSSAVETDAAGYAILTKTGLPADTSYYYGIRVGDVVYTDLIGQTKTAPTTDFSFVWGTCMDTGVGHIFQNIRTRAPDLFINIGDLFYGDITSNNESLFHAQFDSLLASADAGELLRSVATFYMFSDHDYAANNHTASSPARTASLTAHRKRVPNPNRVENGATDAAYYSFTIGRVLFIATDLRSMKSAQSDVDNASKTMMGAVQKQWFKDLLVNPDYAYHYIVWMNEVPWIGVSDTDSWAGYATERAELASYITAKGLTDRMCIISGDAHMVAYDNGTNSPGGIPVFHAAPLSRDNTTKGGPYSGGTFIVSTSQYGVMDIADDGSTITLDFTGIAVDTETGEETTLITASHEWTRPAPSAPVIDSVTINDTTPTVGRVLRASISYANQGYPHPAETLQWFVDGIWVGTGSTYKADDADLGKAITVTGTAANAHGSDSVSSSATAAVAPALDPPTLVQAKSYGIEGPVNSRTITLDAPATAGNVLVLFAAVDKVSGTITPADSDFTLISSHVTGTSISGAVFYKVADGGEQNITVNLGAGVTNNITLAVAEYANLGAPTASALGNGNASTTRTVTTGFVPVQEGQLVMAFWANDSIDTVLANTGAGWGTGWTEILAQHTTGNVHAGTHQGEPAISVATRSISADTYLTARFTYTGGTIDQNLAFIVAFDPA